MVGQLKKSLELEYKIEGVGLGSGQIVETYQSC